MVTGDSRFSPIDCGGKRTLDNYKGKRLNSPNDVCLGTDGKTLYVAQSDPTAAIWKSFPVKDDGTIGEDTVFHDATEAFQMGSKWTQRVISGRLAREEFMSFLLKENFLVGSLLEKRQQTVLGVTMARCFT